MNTLRRLWNDEQGFVVSAELVLVASVAVLAMIVGLAAYRDAIIDELADGGRAVNALNQSYSVAVGNSVNNDPEAGVVIAESGGVVTVSRSYGFGAGVDPVVVVSATFNNFGYTDAADFCEAGTITRTSGAGNNENTPAPAVP